MQNQKGANIRVDEGDISARDAAVDESGLDDSTTGALESTAW